MHNPILTQLLPFELTNNNQGRGRAWYSSANVRKKIERELRLLGLEREPFEFPVVVRVTRILGKGQRLWDSDSILRGNSKELIDSLVVCGWFHNDSPKWIVETQAGQDASQRANGPAVLIEVFRA